ncbi:MAG: A/G-specific adenine glycosylase [Holophagales bacterium]|nr:A/G-specific adenine glycosylase [Holophagales bacterium]MYF94492.1 A/G-specific adenine glycosylase [Holophagales bacterium]
MLQLVEPEELRGALLAWFDRCRRDLPWRRTEDPYEILVAEIMLQQTRSEVVATRYQGFLDRFPRVDDLAEAPVDSVEAAWSGLGYYRRARNLHRAARILAERGRLPASAAEWAELPGIGAYTSALLASRCCGESSPVLDGNVERVLSRFLASGEPPRRAAARRKLLATAARLLDPSRPGDSNQALMEVGSLVCRRGKPDCGACPLAPGCRAFRSPGLDPRAFPVAGPRRAREVRHCFTAVVRRGDELLLHRRPGDADWLAGRWHLPTVELASGDESARVAEALGREYGGSWECDERAVLVRHAVTYREFLVRAAVARWRPERTPEETAANQAPVDQPSLVWFRDSEIDGLPTSSLLRKTLDSVGANRADPPIHSGP